jgi:hypothetical protein
VPAGHVRLKGPLTLHGLRSYAMCDRVAWSIRGRLSVSTRTLSDADRSRENFICVLRVDGTCSLSIFIRTSQSCPLSLWSIVQKELSPSLLFANMN